MLALLFVTAAALAAPCTTASPSCTEWIQAPGQESRVLVYRTYPLATRNENITRALIFVHGINRDADNHFRTVLAAAFLAGALDDTVIIAPRFASSSSAPGNESGDCHDPLAPNEANWICQAQRPDTWRSGGPEIGPATEKDKVTSFDFADEIIRRLAQKDIFPNLKKIVVAGHSAGGQFVMRYEMSSPVPDSARIPISYVVANPSSYAYLDTLRPTANALPATIAPGFTPPVPATPPAPFVPFSDAKNCTGYNNWPYGLKNRSGYAARINDDQLQKQLVNRSVTYLLGEVDILPLGIFDTSCPAMAQGTTRLARGLAFGKYVKEIYGAQHATVVVPFCSHSARCMFTADITLPLIFPK